MKISRYRKVGIWKIEINPKRGFFPIIFANSKDAKRRYESPRYKIEESILILQTISLAAADLFFMNIMADIKQLEDV